MANATFADLFGSDLLLHYDVSDASKLFTDTGGTSAAANGNEVKCLKPQSDAALQINLTNSNGPTYRSNYASSGYAALEFDGVNDALVQATTGLTSTRFFVLAAFTPISSVGTIWNRGATVSNMARVYWNGTNSYVFQSLGGTNDVNTTAILVSGKVVVSVSISTSQTQIDALGPSAGFQNHTISSSIAQNFNLGVSNFSGFTQYGNFAFHELLLIGANCEWGQVLRGSKILRNKWGITDPNALPQAAGGTSGFTGLSGVGRLGT